MSTNPQQLIEKLQSLPPERLAEVADFVDFLQAREAQRNLICATTTLSEPVFARIWDNPEDAEYDAL